MFKTIVWANDGSESAEKALPLVKALAKEGGATVTIVHVVERVEGIGAVGIPHRADEPEVQAQLQKLAAALTEEGINATLEVRGDVGTRPGARGRGGSAQPRRRPDRRGNSRSHRDRRTPRRERDKPPSSYRTVSGPRGARAHGRAIGQAVPPATVGQRANQGSGAPPIEPTCAGQG